ncbi:hydrogenase expression/formation protein HypE [Vibrio sp. S11_S32]|uniref:hydrogenase expression/formation protein HypE n=1 Tax=Vibrio sp. S11_S32 TaxID=2720225 RepID=UPI0016811346|nr:hydrogenase expression/formation protein HypE [Vibrio sp. S11_S32]MBD1577163.1 hydrogenase expression/formation protein HypE [Vibrio sp. S11_S32]
MKQIQLSHGGGGQEMNSLIHDLFFRHFANDILLKTEDAAVLPTNGKIAFTTDSFTVAPIFFAGGDIGKLAIAGTVNDLAMMGAKPEYLSCSFMIEEGFNYAELKTIVQSMQKELEVSGAKIVCGDTKVVPKGTLDGVFINTTGVGSFYHQQTLSASAIQDGDAILVSRDIGCHGSCILMARDALKLASDLTSDCATLWPVVEALLDKNITVRTLRDATRGGISAVLNEWCELSKVEMNINEADIPVSDEVKGLCELYGFEPYDLANEGTMVIAVPQAEVEATLAVLRHFSASASHIGNAAHNQDGNHKVILHSPWGSRRYLELPQGELLPRIC